MAVISKIRNKAGLAVGVVGFSLFAFILGDFFSNKRGYFGKNDTTVGVIAGKKVNVQDFEAKVQTLITNYKLNQNTENVDQNTIDQLREQAWNQLVTEEVMGKQYDKTGITVSSEELFDMVKGKNPHPQVKQAFTDPKTGQFNPANVINFLKNMDNDQTGRTRAQWVIFEKAIQEERMQQKYNNLVKNGLFIPDVEAKEDFINKNKTASIKYVLLPYTSISDSSVQVSDDELKNIYNENLKRYKQVASRAIDYVTFDVNPTEIDRQEALKSISNLAEEFKAANNDSAYVALNSDTPFDPAFHKKGTLPVNLDSVMFSAATGTLIGPYEENAYYKLAKLSGSKFLPDSVKASHILLKMDESKKDAIMATADSIKKAIIGGADMALLSFQYSTDEAAKQKGGDLGWFGSGMMVKEFNDACFEGKKGDVVVVTTQFGVHILKIVDQKGSSRQVQVAIVSRKIEASTKTYQAVFQKANNFTVKYTTADLFDKGVKDENLTKLSESNIIETAKQVGPLENSRELVRWAFNAKIGDVSKAFEFGNRFVIGKLTDAREKGFSTLDQVKDQVTAEAKKDKKAAMLIEKFKKAGNSTNIDAISSAVGQPATVAENVSFASPFLGNAGMEANVVGHLMVMKQGQVSAPLKGQSGVFVIAVNSIKEAEVPKDLKEASEQLSKQYQGRAQYEVFNALKEKANVDDRRGKFY